MPEEIGEAVQPANVKALMAFAPHVGIFILTFSVLDVHLARIISYVHPRCGVEGVNLKIPRELTKKIGQVRRAFSETAALSPWKSAMLTVLEDIEKLKPTRDLFSHGEIALNTLELQALYFTKINPCPNNSSNQIEEVFSISKSDLKSEASEALRITARLLTIMAEIMRSDEKV